jgi:alpha-N-arabinofuranosidase
MEKNWIAWAPFGAIVLIASAGVVAVSAFSPPEPPASIEIDASKPGGTVSDTIFAQNLEHEHGTFSGGEQNSNHEHGLHTGGLWAEMLRDRKFEEGDLDRDGVANGWVPEERVTNRYYEILDGRGMNDRYRIDNAEYYGGGAAQAIEVYGDASSHASIYQVGLHFSKGRRYSFYVYLKGQGPGSAWAEFDSRDAGSPYGRAEFGQPGDAWKKYSADFTAPEDTDAGRVRIAVKGPGTLWIDSASLMPAENFHGMRADVVEAVKPLKVPMIRYPGGCFADIYHWKDGVGDRDRRPERWSSMWNEWEPNDFGTDEFMELAGATGFEPHMTTNYLSGTAEEAGQWVEYANGSSDTPLGRLRVQNGHAKPYGIKLWAVGNEVQQLCSDPYFAHNDVNRYAERFKEFRRLMRQADPSVRVMAVGAGPGPLKWNHDLLALVPDGDFMGFSIYTGEGNRIDDYDTKYVDLNHFYRHVVAEPLDLDHELQAVIESMGSYAQRDHPSLALTEFQAWWLTEKVDEDFRLGNALYIAGVYNALMRRANQVAIAEIESLINVQGIIEVSQASLKLTPEYFACMLYRLHTGKTVLATSAHSPAVEWDQKLPALDAIATRSEDGRTLYVAVVNRAEGNAVRTNIRLNGWKVSPEARVYEINGNDKNAANPFGSSENVNIREKSWSPAGSEPSYSFPPHSVTVLELKGAV